MLPDRMARLLLVSSQARPPSSIVSFHKATANLTDSSVSLLFSTTVLPSASTSLPPHDHRVGVPPARRVAEGVPGGLPVRVPGSLQFLAGGAVLVPSLREFPVEA